MKKKELKNIYFNYFYNLIANNFKWENLPAEIPFRWATHLILNYGKFGIFEGEYLKISGYGAKYPLTEYGEQTSYLMQNKYETKEFLIEEKNAVKVIGANNTRTSPLEFLEMEIEKIVDLDIAIQVNLKNQNRTKIIGVKDKNTKLTIEKTLEKIDNGEISVFVAKNIFDEENLKILDLSSNLYADKLYELRQNIINEIFEYYGISSRENKKERVQVGELVNNTMLAYDNIFAIIDCINLDFERYGIETRVYFNGAINDFNENQNLQNENYDITKNVSRETKEGE